MRTGKNGGAQFLADWKKEEKKKAGKEICVQSFCFYFLLEISIFFLISIFVYLSFVFLHLIICFLVVFESSFCSSQMKLLGEKKNVGVIWLLQQRYLAFFYLSLTQNIQHVLSGVGQTKKTYIIRSTEAKKARAISYQMNHQGTINNY